MLQQLGPTWVKIGQIASSQAGSMPKEWADELAKLQNTVAPFPYEQAKKIVEGELGKPLEQLFLSFEEKPLAAASTAQVHRATLPSGDEVASVQKEELAMALCASSRTRAAGGAVGLTGAGGSAGAAMGGWVAFEELMRWASFGGGVLCRQPAHCTQVSCLF